MQTKTLPRVDLDKVLAQPAANDRPAESSENLEMVRRIVGAMLRRLPAHVDKDELISLGYMGLVEAQQRFDKTRGVPFGAYAAMRVRGAIIDHLRQLDPVSRAERARLRSSEAAASVTLVDFDAADHVASGRDTDEELMAREQKLLLGRALGKLPERERLVVTRYFFEEKSLKQIGVELGVTEGRVCQIVSAVTARLRNLMAQAELKEAA